MGAILGAEETADFCFYTSMRLAALESNALHEYEGPVLAMPLKIGDVVELVLVNDCYVYEIRNKINR